MVNTRKSIKSDDVSAGECHYNAMHDKSVYEVDCSDSTMDQLTANIIYENMLSQVDPEEHHCQVLTKMTYL